LRIPCTGRRRKEALRSWTGLAAMQWMLAQR
jgi:hypothetical protein